MRSLVSTLALVCLLALGGVCQSTDAASDRIVVVGNKAQPVQWNHRETIQEAINLAKPSGTVIIPTNYPGSDCNPLSNCNPGNVCVIDWRINGVGTGNCNSGNGGPVGAATTEALVNCTATGTTLNKGVELSSQVVSGSLTACGTTASASSTSVIGICASSCGASGTAQIAYQTFQSCVFDNQSVIGDVAAPSVNPGQCTDIGPSRVPGVESMGRISSLNSGSGIATINLGTMDMIASGGSNGSGNVSQCNTSGGVSFYSAIGTIVVCDPNATLDGNGKLTTKQVVVNGTGPGTVTLQTGTAPANPSAGNGLLYVDSGTGFLSCLNSAGGSCNPSGSSAFSAITNGTNTTAAMHVGTGASLDTSGSGTIVGTGLTTAKTQGTDTKYATDAGTGASGATLCRDALGGISSTGCTAPLVAGIVTSGLLAEYRFNEGTGTTLTDYSGSGNNGTFCASGPAWVAADPTNGGLQFDGVSNCINLPAALNSARTIILVTSFVPPNTQSLQTPLCGNTANNWGAMFRGYQLDPGVLSPPLATANGGEYVVGGWARNGSAYQINTDASAQGTQIIGWTLGSASDSTHDQVWVNNNLFPYSPTEPLLFGAAGFGGTPQSTGLQSGGNFVMGGTPAGQCTVPVATWFRGAIYYALFYSGFLTQSQLGQNFVVIASSLAQRGIKLGSWNPGSAQASSPQNQNNQFVAVGDSITYGTGLSTAYPQYMTFPSTYNAWNWVDIGQPSITALQYSNEGAAQLPQSWLYPNGASNAVMVWLGTNDCGGNTLAAGQNSYASLTQALRQFRLHGTTSLNQKLIVASMVSRTTRDNCKNGLNNVLRQQWSAVADGFADVAADTNLGADGASAGTTYFQGDAVHPTSYAQANDIAPIMQRAVRRAFGNLSWTSATTYTTAAAAATATTAGSEATNTVTITFGATPANCVAGNQITIAGTTPAGYSGTWQILTRTATQVTYFDASGLGAITVQGTGVCASQQDEDVYTILGGSAAGNPSFTLESCVGYTGQNLYFKNTNTTSAWVLTPFGSETIDGAATLTMPTASSGNNPVVILQSTLVSAAAGGCNWKRIQ